MSPVNAAAATVRPSRVVKMRNGRANSMPNMMAVEKVWNQCGS